mgnify:CR=1 FL=1
METIGFADMLLFSDAREYAAILAGLRLRQHQINPSGTLGIRPGELPNTDEIASCGGDFAPLTETEIEALIDRLQTA